MATKGGLIVGPVSFDTNTFSKRLSDFVLLVEHHELVKRLDKIREYASHPQSLLIKRTHESLRKAATQLSGTRPGLIWVHLHDLSEERLVQLNQKFEDGGITGVEEICILHFTNPSRSHVYGLAFSGDSKTVYAEGLGFREMRRSGNLLLRYNQNCKFDISLEQKDWFFGGA
jgi:hypothetical protein